MPTDTIYKESVMQNTIHEAVALTQQMVRIESTNPGSYEAAMGAFVERWLKDAGAAPRRQEVLPGRFNVCARLEGPDDVPGLVYICHMDTVPVGEGWTRDPFGGTIENGLMYGRGSCDMKSGLACAMLAFRDVIRAGKPLCRRFTFIASMDEEDRMRGGEAAVEGGWIRPQDFVLDAEPTAGLLRSGHKGKSWYYLRTHGKVAHASMPEHGADAIAAMSEGIAEILHRFAQIPEAPGFGKASATFGSIQGGLEENIVPENCFATLDMRLVPPLTVKDTDEIVDTAMKKAVERVPGTTYTIERTAHKPVIPQALECPLFMSLSDAFRQATGKQPEQAIFTGYTDSAVASAMTGNPNCVSYGPGDLALAHVADEYVPCSDIEEVCAVLSRLALNLTLGI